VLCEETLGHLDPGVVLRRTEDDDRVLGSTKTARWSYSTSKAMAEHLVFAMRDAHGLPVTVVRYFNVYGPRQNPIFVISQSIHRILNGRQPLLYDSGDQSRCFTYVDDAVAGTLLASESSLAIGEAFDPVELGPGGGTGTLTIQSGATVSVSQETALFPGATLKLEGGTLDTQSVSFQGGGAFAWTGGTLHVGTFNGNLVNQGGKLAPGHSPGTTTVSGNYTQNMGTLEIEIGGTSAGHGEVVRQQGSHSFRGEDGRVTAPPHDPQGLTDDHRGRSPRAGRSPGEGAATGPDQHAREGGGTRRGSAHHGAQ